MRYHRLSRCVSIVVLALACAATALRRARSPSGSRARRTSSPTSSGRRPWTCCGRRRAIRRRPTRTKSCSGSRTARTRSRDTAAALEHDRAAGARVPREPLGEAGAVASHRDRAAHAAQRRPVVHGDAAATAARTVPPRAATPAAVPVPAAPPAPVAVRRGELPPTPPAPPAPAAVPPAAAHRRRRPRRSRRGRAAWLPDNYLPDTDLRIQALGSLIRTDAPRVIPMLKEIALDSGESGRSAPRALRARPVRTAGGALHGRGGGEDGPRAGSHRGRPRARTGRRARHRERPARGLLDVEPAVKYEVVSSLGERAATTALCPHRAVRNGPSAARPRDRDARRSGRTGAAAPPVSPRAADTKRPIIVALFNARAEEELIRIADRERDPAVRQDILSRLRLLGTPRAKAYLESARQK